MDEKIRDVKPYGHLHTTSGQSYFLLSPEPYPAEDWQRPDQQRFVVVSLAHTEKVIDVPLYEVAFFVVTTGATIEIRDVPSIKVKEKEAEYMQDADFDELPEGVHEPEWIQEDLDSFLVSVGAGVDISKYVDEDN